jgi:phenylacetaldehyde dehydrogenase
MVWGQADWGTRVCQLSAMLCSAGSRLFVQVGIYDDVVPAVSEITKTGLSAWIWTRDISQVHRWAKSVTAGTFWVNCYSIFDAALPFGGYKQSGWGREMGHAALENYLQTKSICLKLLN